MGSIQFFVGEHAFLSNFFPSPIMYGAIDYPTVEHGFQAQKFLTITEKLRVAAAETPGQSKRLGRSAILPDNWENEKIQIMKDLLILKFLPGSDLAHRLVATLPFSLVEGNTWHDQIWGSCKCEKHNLIPGMNHLGNLLTDIRTDLIR